MAYRLEIALKSDLFDAEGNGIRKKAKNYFGIDLDSIRCIHIVTIDAHLSEDQLKTIQREIFTNPVTQISSFDPLDLEFDWTIWVGYRPGVRDNPGSTALEAVEDILGITFGPGQA
ncbi:MAG: phosphoribosylformylglycinamidine synthase, partial [Desulfobacterales bacterium]